MNLFFPFQYFILYNISTNLQKSSKNFISAVKKFYPFQRSVAFHLICYANQMTGFYVKCNTGLKFVSPFFGIPFKINPSLLPSRHLPAQN